MALPEIPIDLSLLPTQEGVYIVGGTVRDLLLGKKPVDYDIAVCQNPEIFAEKTAAACRGRMVPMGRPGKMSYRVVSRGIILDITGVSGPSIRTDLDRRDVTINAMAMELSSGALLDWVGGRRDLADGRIRMVAETGFRDDPIRLLRVFRLAAALGFSVDEHTVSAATRDAPLIRHSAGERIRSELYQLFSCKESSPHVALMAETGLLRAILQEPLPLPAVGNTDSRDADLRSRLLPAYRHLEALLNHPPPGFQTLSTGSEPPIDRDQAAWVKFSKIMVLQQRSQAAGTAGKPDGGAMPADSDTSAAHVAEAVCRRLRLSVKERRLVTGIVGNHSLPFHLYDAFAGNRLTAKTVTRFFMAVDTLAPHLLLCALAEALDGDFDRATFSDFTRHMFRTYYETYLPGKTRPPFVSGRDLMNIFDLPASPLLKTLLTRLEEGRLSGELTDREAALEVAERIIREFRPKGNRI